MSELGDKSEQKQINKAIAYATRLLSSREYSTKSLSRKLRHKGYLANQVDEAMEYLLSQSWVSNERFCESFIRSRVKKGQGESRIRYELSQHGIADYLVERAMAEQSVCWQSICNQVAEKKWSLLNADDWLKQRIKLERFLRYRGFDTEQINRSLVHIKKRAGDGSGDYDQ